MKVLIVAYSFAPNVGGTEITAELMARGFTSHYRDDVTVITHTSESLQDEDRLPFRVVRQPGIATTFREVKKADVALHNNPALKYAWPHLLLSRPLIITMRSWLTDQINTPGIGEITKARIKMHFLRRSSILIANSRAMAGHVLGARDVVTNSYRDEIFYVRNEEKRPRKNIAYVGRLIDHKGVDILLNAVAEVKRTGLSPHLRIIGDGPDRPRLERLVGDLGLHDDVDFLGHLKAEETARELNDVAIVAVPSQWAETFGTVIVEAAACGAVPFATRHGGTADAIGDAGPLVAPGSVDEIISTIIELMTNDELYENYQSRLASHAAKYSGNRMISRYHEMLVRAYSYDRSLSRFKRLSPLPTPIPSKFLPSKSRIGQPTLVVLSRTGEPFDKFQFDAVAEEFEKAGISVIHHKLDDRYSSLDNRIAKKIMPIRSELLNLGRRLRPPSRREALRMSTVERFTSFALQSGVNVVLPLDEFSQLAATESGFPILDITRVTPTNAVTLYQQALEADEVERSRYPDECCPE